MTSGPKGGDAVTATGLSNIRGPFAGVDCKVESLDQPEVLCNVLAELLLICHTNLF